MHKLIFNLAVVCLAIAIVGCGPKKPASVAPAAEPGEKLIWSSFDKRPGWTVMEPETVEDELAFVGLSGKFTTEKDSRDDAMRAAVDNVVKYIGTLAQNKFEELQTSHKLSSEIVDPTKVTRGLKEQLSSAFATRIKPKEWYTEKWYRKKTKETYFVTFVLAKVPKSSIDKAYEGAMDATIEDLKTKRDEANEEKAKEQFENAMKVFEEAKEQGFTIE